MNPSFHGMCLQRSGDRLTPFEQPIPELRPGELLIEVEACGICRTDLHLIDGELEEAGVTPRYPVIPGHQIVGRVCETAGQTKHRAGTRVGIPWLGSTCGRCAFCRRGEENLCPHAVFTGATRDGGFASHATANDTFAFALPEEPAATDIAPLLCAGLIGYRSYRIASPEQKLGLYGFGSAAHLLCQLAVQDGLQVYAFTRPGDDDGQHFARGLGACWAGGSDQQPPASLDAAIIFAQVGALVPSALSAVRPGGRVVCAGIHMSDIPAFPYHLLWQERQLRSVANLTRRDGEEFLARVAEIEMQARVHCFALSEANEALDALRAGVEGSVVLRMAA